MSEREWRAFVGLHHLNTVLGLAIGAINYLRGKKDSLRRRFLFAFILTQIWAFMKIAVSAAAKESLFSMEKSREHICKFCKNKRQEKLFYISLSWISTLFKLGTPLLLRS